MILLRALMSTAFADGLPSDIELVNPTFDHDSFLGVAAPRSGRSTRLGGLVQLEKDPLIAYEGGIEMGSVVAERLHMTLGAAADFGERFTGRFALPMAAQWGSEVPELAGDGVAAGDLGAGLDVLVSDRDHLDVGLLGNIRVPTGGQASYMGEAQPRFVGGVAARVPVGSFRAQANLAIQGRAAVPTDLDWNLGPEALVNLGLAETIWPERLVIEAALLTKTSLSSPLAIGAENGSELLTGVQFWPTPDFQADLGIGKGLASGAGTTEFRALFGLTWTPPKKDAPILVPVMAAAEIPPDAPPPPVVPVEEPLAHIDANEIIIRDPIQFEVNTAHILPESQPILEAVAKILLDHAEIGHLVIEGHASEEGSFEYNYDLSNLRARSVYQALVGAGVHPDRMSYRGMGEVRPVATGDDETHLAPNRRVEFHIVRYYAPGEGQPYATAIVLPWSGADATIPAQNPPPAPEPVGTFKDDANDDDLETP